jgi:hypothetical protein
MCECLCVCVWKIEIEGKKGSLDYFLIIKMEIGNRRVM